MCSRCGRCGRRQPSISARRTEAGYGKERDWIAQIAGARRRRQSGAPDRAGAWPARPEHHGVLQGVQRADPENGEGRPDPRHHHDLSGPLLHLGVEDAAGVIFPQEGGKARQRFEDSGPRAGRQGHQAAGARDRSTEDEGPELRHRRSGDEDDRRLRPLDGPLGDGVTTMAIGKRTKKAREGIDREKAYSITEAVKLVKERSKAKFDETIEIAMNLGVDPTHADQMVRGVVTLPNGSGRTLRVGAFARGAKADEAKRAGAAVGGAGAEADEAKAAGADVVGAEDLVEKVGKCEIDFDRCIATPDLMPLVGRLGKVLGPRGIMPNPKVGTVTMDVTNAVKGAKGGSVEFRVEKAGIIQAGVGKASF